MTNFKGTGVALITPFNNDNTIDYLSIDKLLNHVINGGVNYIVLLGTTGESVTLSLKEKNEIINFSKKIINNRIPILVGIGGNNTNSILQEIEILDLNGVSGILSVSPYYNKPTQEGIYNHYRLISEHSKLPIILYNVPSRTGSNISSDTVLKLAHSYNNIVGIKEASGDMNQIMTILKEKPNKFDVISGDDALTLPMIYLGSCGVISVIGQAAPSMFSKMVNHALNMDILEANKIHNKIFDYYSPLFEEGNPVGIKALLKNIGLCKNNVRSPLVKASNKLIKKLNSLEKIY